MSSSEFLSAGHNLRGIFRTSKKFTTLIRLLAFCGITAINILPITNAEVLAQANESQEKQRKLNLAILIFDSVQIIDYTGPYETFGHAYDNDGPLFNIYTVASKIEPITTAMGMSVNPRWVYAAGAGNE